MKHYSLRVYQAFLFLLAAIPCAIPYRYDPNPIFPSEVAAYALCGLLVLAAGLLPVSPAQRRTGMPWMMAPWCLLGAVIVIQMVVLPVVYWSERTVPLAYVLGAGLTVWSLARARDEFTLQPLATALAWGLVLGALFNSFLAVPQVIEVIKHGGLVFGNIGEKNMYGHYLAWGIASVVWLAAGRTLPRWLAVVLVAWLALSTAWCGSRSIFMYLAAWWVFGALLFISTRDRNRRFAAYLFGAATLMMAMQFIAPVVSGVIEHFVHANNAVPTGLARLDANGARRLVEWRKAWIVFLQHPVLGVGLGGFGAESVRLQVIPAFARVEEDVLFTHCHNSILQLMAETGALGTTVVVLPILAAFAALWRRRHDAVAVFGAAMALVSVLHSLVQYPLWYFHFLVPFALMLFFMFDGTWGDVAQRPTHARGRQWTAVLGGLALTALSVTGFIYYLRLYPIMEAADTADENLRRIRILERWQGNPLMDYFADFGISSFIVPSTTDTAWKLGIIQHLNTIRPYYYQLVDESIMLALDNGDMNLAHLRMRQAAFSFPDSLGYYRHEIGLFPHSPRVQSLIKEVQDGEAMFGKREYNPDDG